MFTVTLSWGWGREKWKGVIHWHVNIQIGWPLFPSAGPRGADLNKSSDTKPIFPFLGSKQRWSTRSAQRPGWRGKCPSFCSGGPVAARSRPSRSHCDGCPWASAASWPLSCWLQGSSRQKNSSVKRCRGPHTTWGRGTVAPWMLPLSPPTSHRPRLVAHWNSVNLISGNESYRCSSGFTSVLRDLIWLRRQGPVNTETTAVNKTEHAERRGGNR